MTQHRIEYWENGTCAAREFATAGEALTYWEQGPRTGDVAKLFLGDWNIETSYPNEEAAHDAAN